MQALDRRLSILLTTLLVGGCASHDEVSRVPSPDTKLDAVLVENSSRLTTSFWYEVFVVPSGFAVASVEPVADIYGAIRNTGAYGANLKWLQPDLLTVEFESAHSVEQVRSEAQVAGRLVRIVLYQGITDSSAPPGSMLRNRRPHTGGSP